MITVPRNGIFLFLFQLNVLGVLSFNILQNVL